MRVLVAGATGAIGRRLVPQLVERGDHVIATTRNADNACRLRALGGEPVVVDGLDGVAIGEVVARAEPDAIVHHMTALAAAPDMRRSDRWFAATNEVRTRGTEHLLAAARGVGVRRFIAQSYTGWTNIRVGGPIETEEDPFDPDPPKAQRETLAAIRSLERAVLEAPLEGIVLRYGNLYGPGSSEGIIELVRRRRLPIVGGGTGSGPGYTSWMRPPPRWSRSDVAGAASTTSLTTTRRRCRSGCLTWPKPFTRSRPTACRCGLAGLPSAMCLPSG